MKVRGTAQTVADKYLQLARDAVSSGDIIMSESYFQHAEHYNRIVAANQSQHQQHQQHQQRNQESAPEAAATSEEVPGTGPQPVEARSEATASESERTAPATNGEGDMASFDGDLPQFLQQPVEEGEKAEKPKKSKRSSRSRSAKSEEAGDEAAVETASAEPSEESSSDAEAAVG